MTSIHTNAANAMFKTNFTVLNGSPRYTRWRLCAAPHMDANHPFTSISAAFAAISFSGIGWSF